MALLHCDFFSETLGLCCNMDVILPEHATRGQIGLDGNASSGPGKVLYLLHGLSDDHTIWQRRTSIERYAAAYGLTVVMPTTHRAFYTDTQYGMKYFTYISEELPRIVQSFFRVSDRPEDTYAAGLSMGGYGAFKLGLRCPERFAGVASLSGVVDIVPRRMAESEEFRHVFGAAERIEGSDNDLVAVAERRLAAGDRLPRFYQVCGTEDFLYETNVAFRDRFKGRLDLEYHEAPGTHEWGFWDEWIQDVLRWMYAK